MILLFVHLFVDDLGYGAQGLMLFHPTFPTISLGFTTYNNHNK